MVLTPVGEISCPYLLRTRLNKPVKAESQRTQRYTEENKDPCFFGEMLQAPNTRAGQDLRGQGLLTVSDANAYFDLGNRITT